MPFDSFEWLGQKARRAQAFAEKSPYLLAKKFSK
jgi:hypothetical protein